MSDLISREDAVKAIRKCKFDSDMPSDWYRGMECAQDIVEDVPSAEAEPINCVKCKHYYETENDTDVHGNCRMDTAHADLISRADAIEAVCGDCTIENRESCKRDGYCYEVRNLMALPSADAEWIPCSERLPNEDECGWYLVTVKGHELFVDVAPFNDELWKGLASHQEVIAWMPLPKPYREEGEV